MDDKAREAFDAAREALPEFRQQDDYLLAHGASLMSEDSHEIVHVDTVRKIVAAALQWAASQQAAEGDDELLRLRAKVDALTREAWTWSKACESESMRIHGVKDAINKAYGIVSKEHPWTPEHSKNYPQQAANIINAAMTIFAPPSTQGGADEQR
jgi:hypothetical protein